MNNKEITIRSSAAEYLIFVAATGENPSRVELRYEDENIWLTQRMMAELYGVFSPALWFLVLLTTMPSRMT